MTEIIVAAIMAVSGIVVARIHTGKLKNRIESDDDSIQKELRRIHEWQDNHMLHHQLEKLERLHK